MSHAIAHLNSVHAVDNAIMSEDDRLVCIRFGHDNDAQCIELDETLFRIVDKFHDKVAFYLVDSTLVPQYNKTFSLVGNCNLVFFHNNQIVSFDYGEGSKDRIDSPIPNVDVLSDIIETVYEGARRGKEYIATVRDYSPEVNYLTGLYPSESI